MHLTLDTPEEPQPEMIRFELKHLADHVSGIKGVCDTHRHRQPQLDHCSRLTLKLAIHMFKTLCTELIQQQVKSRQQMETDNERRFSIVVLNMLLVQSSL